MLAQVISRPCSASRTHLGGLVICYYHLSRSRGPGTMRGDLMGGAAGQIFFLIVFDTRAPGGKCLLILEGEVVNT